MVDLKDFCLISLVSGIYKIVAKVLANRLKMVFSKSKKCLHQGKADPRPCSHCNECLDSKIKYRPFGVLCKLDLEKAYNHINWDFLLYMLRRSGFWGEVVYLDSPLYLIGVFLCVGEWLKN